MRTRLVLALMLAFGAGGAVVLDRIAVTVGKSVITETEVDQEIRVAALLNGDPPDFSADARRRAAGRLVDQELIRREMELSKWQPPETADAAKMMAQLKRERFPNEAQYRQALSRYGLSEAELLRHVSWQLSTLQYTDYRFQPLPKGEGAVHPRTDEAGAPPAPAQEASSKLDEQMDAWLKDARSRTRIIFREEAFR